MLSKLTKSTLGAHARARRTRLPVWSSSLRLASSIEQPNLKPPKEQPNLKGSQRKVSGLASVADTWKNPVLEVPPPRPATKVPDFCTKNGYIVLPPNGDLSRPYAPHVESLKNSTPCLNDSRSRSPAELEALREEIRSSFHASLSLFEGMHEMFRSSPAFFVKHETLRHPPIFYLGHTASFYINKLNLGQWMSERIDPELEIQMAVGVDEMSWDDWDSNSYVWHSGDEAHADIIGATAFLQKVFNFRRDVRVLVDKLIAEYPMEWPIKKDSFWWIIIMGIEHERIHLETSSVILRQAKMEYVQQVPAFPEPCPHGVFSALPIDADLVPKNRLIPVEAGSTRLGRSWDDTSTYGWDNEFGHEKQHQVPAFAASEFLVSNMEFKPFVADGGYTTERYWTQEGWQWISDMKFAAPRFWKYTDTGLKLRTLNEEISMAWDWPVEVNHHEAAAFCKYLSEKTGKNLRLPLEDEFMRLRDAEPRDLQHSRHGPAWGEKAPGNVNLDHWSTSCPVNQFQSPSGIYDVLGNVWQHSLTTIDVCPGFQTHPLYDDFTTPTVGDCHSRIMGGSWISTGTNGGTRDARFGFRRHFYQHAGFRYVESDREISSGVVPFERDRTTCDAFRFHFDEPSFGENFPVKLAQVSVDAMIESGMRLDNVRVLELGCGPGRTALELAKHGISSVHGAARTAKEFNGTAQHFMKDGRLRWTNFTEGDFVDHREISMDDLGLKEEHKSSVSWHQIPDFANIDHNKFQNFDVVVCAQPGVLSEADAVGVLTSMHEVVKPGGLLIVGSQYDWVPKTGAVSQSGGDAVVGELLKPWFEPVHDPLDISFVKAETARKFSCGNQHITFWKRIETDSACSSHTTALTNSSDQAAALGQAMYDDDCVVGHYLDFHFGPNSDYPVTCASRCVEAVRELGLPLGRALEVGGGPGRAGLELSKHFEHVDSGDYSQSFVNLGNKLLKDGKLEWRVAFDRTAGIVTERSVSIADLGAGNVTFSQMDAQALPANLSNYDLICGFNLIDRLPRPKEFLLSVKDRLAPGGLLVLSSPYTWLEEFTAREEWLGAFKYGDNDGPTTYTGMKEILLAAGFEEAKAPQDIWFRIDELDNGRKSQQTCAEMTFWKLREE